MNCSVTNCNRKKHAKGLCSKHNMQVQRYGQLLERTRSSPNEFIIEGDIVKIVLYDVKHNPRAEALIDKVDLKKVIKHKWHLSYGYPITNQCGRISLHRFLMGEKVDHIDRNPLNNCRSNLRPCTIMQNAYNSRKRSDNTSGYKGVCWNARENKWQVRVGANKKSYFLGWYKDIIEAAKAYDSAALRLHGEFAHINFK